MNTRPTILILCDYYLPGFKAGGLIRALANLVDHLGDEFQFKIVTGPRDIGEPPYKDVDLDTWTKVGRAEVVYALSSSIAGLLSETPCDLVYLNSFSSKVFSRVPIWLRFRGRIPRKPFLLAPRGELSPEALAIKPLRKRAYIWMARNLGFYRDIIWHASGEKDEAEIRRAFPDARVIQAPDLPVSVDAEAQTSRSEKPAGRLKVAFLGRICRLKNIDGALEALKGVEGEITFSVYGPIEDGPYWNACVERARALGPSVRMEHGGAVRPDRVVETLRQHDLFFLPSRSENFGHVVFEALAAGCPLLLSDRTPWRDLERLGVGWDVPLDQIDRFRDILRRCVRMGPEEHRALSDRALDYARGWALQSGAQEKTRRLFRTLLEAKNEDLRHH